MSKSTSKITYQVPFNIAEPQEKEGYLFKRGNSLASKGYQPRWFILHDMSLYYFKAKPKNGKAEFCGVLSLKDAQLSDVDEPGKPNSFSIVTPATQHESARQYWLRTDTALLKKEWLLYLTKKMKGTSLLSGEVQKYTMTHDDIVAGLKRMYQERMEALERRFLYDEFFGPILRKSDFEALPHVLLLGQYSVGKTSFIEYLLHRKFPGMRIGPEPTTDKFVALHYSDEADILDRLIPGNALAVDPDRPYSALNKFGTGFLSKFEASCVPSDILRRVTLVDTPGVLSGEKQRIGRDYDFPSVIRQFADSAHMILLIFDAHKLDISDEFKDAIHALRDNKEKIKIILNKADQVTTQQLVRIYGALMWSLGKVINTPEVMRVYIGSFWDKPYKNTENEKLFRAEQQDLLDDLNSLPIEATTRKVNEMVKRVRVLRAHMLTLDYLRKAMPLFGADEKKQKLIANLPKVFEEVSRLNKIPIGDFPNAEDYAKRLEPQDFKKFKELSPQNLNEVEEILTRELPRFMKLTQPDTEEKDDPSNPFGDMPEWSWDVPEDFVSQMSQRWNTLSPSGEALNGAQLKQPLIDSGAQPIHLKKIWTLCDLERSGKLDRDEFILAMWLGAEASRGAVPPEVLPASLIPPSKRGAAGLFVDRR